MATNVELHEALKGELGAEAAKVVAESLPQSQELATRADMQALRLDQRAAARGNAGRATRISKPTSAAACSATSCPCGSASTPLSSASWSP